MKNSKKLLATLLCTTMLATLGMTGCGNKAQQEQPAQPQQQEQQQEQGDGTAIANPMVEYKSLEEVNALNGGNMVHPGVMGVTDEAFYGIDMGDYTIAEYDYSVNGRPFTFRCAPVKEDISGLHLEGRTAFEGMENDRMSVVYTSEWYAERWMVGDMQYVLNCVNNAGLEPMDEETFDNIALEMANMTGFTPDETVDANGEEAEEK